MLHLVPHDLLRPKENLKMVAGKTQKKGTQNLQIYATKKPTFG